MVAVSSSRPASRSALSGRRMPATIRPIATHQAGQRIAVEFGDRHVGAGQDRALEALPHQQRDADDQSGEEGGEPEARAGRRLRPPPRRIEPDGAQQISGQDQVEHRERRRPIGPARAGLWSSMSNQISRAAASAVSTVPAEPGEVRLEPRQPDDAGAEQPAGGEQGLGEDRPLDQAAGDEILARRRARSACLNQT